MVDSVERYFIKKLIVGDYFSTTVFPNTQATVVSGSLAVEPNQAIGKAPFVVDSF